MTNECSINNIANNQESVKTDNIPVCPAVIDKNGKPYTGSTKRNILEGMRPYVESTCHLMGMRYAEHHFKTKADTLERFLERGESSSKAAITEKQIIRNRIYALDTAVNEYVTKLERQSVDLDELAARHYQLTDIMSQWHEAQAMLNSIMAKAVQGQTHIMSNFTEHISAADRREVSPTELITEQNAVKSINAGPTSFMNEGRHFISNKRNGKQHTSRSGETRGSLRERYQNAKKRYRRV